MQVKQPLSSEQIKLFTIYFSIFLAVISICFLVFIQHKSLTAIFTSGHASYQQVAIGLLAGSALAAVIQHAPFLSSLRQFARHMVGTQLKPKRAEIPLFAFATALGEELLFRAILQPFIGLWLTSIIFALSHGGLDFKRKGMVSFNIFLFISSVVMGVLYAHIGLLAAIVAHGTYNVWIMRYATKPR